MRAPERWLAALLGGAALLAWPVIGQEPEVPVEAPAPPRSLLPEGFDAAPEPAPEPVAPADSPDDGAPLGPAAPRLSPLLPAQTEIEEPADPFDVPAATGRPIDVAGPLGPGVTGPGGGYGPLLFQNANGPFLATLMRRMTAPVASRWSAIVLRRALLTEATAPAGISPADWLAERAALLLRLGEIDGAKALIDWAPIDRYSPRLYQVAGQVHLAAADLAGFCPIAATGASLSRDPLWPLAQAMCAGMEGDDISAARLFDQLRKDEKVDEFDILLAERVATISGGGGRAANVAWDLTDRLTPFRYGVATAASVTIPPNLIATLRQPGAAGWLARAPAQTPEARAGALRTAAALGAVSGSDVAGARALSGDPNDPDDPAGRLRLATTGTRLADRLTALRAIWASETTPAGRYGALIESAGAAARLPVAGDAAGDAADIVAALLSIGLDRSAARWANSSDPRVWALLAAGAPDGAVSVTPATFEAWYEAEQARDAGRAKARAALLLGALEGLGRASGDDWDDLRAETGLTPLANGWTRALDAAAGARRTGAVAVLAGTGLQGDWSAVPPQHLRAIAAAYVRVGRGFEARMLAAEAVTRG